ncbi:hypothetical protein [Leuconostoc citreum]|uniref:hypothetical protein n=1 Tax=Leuconostoc citreum TaxID=33964 RepID=UPI0021A57E03|nr:hypothetical protein [Leuconostoc citreum]MCT3077398.1 hypothetical protein [Leuconostoc citreum]
MTETVVHVKTIEQWNSVLDVWFEQGYYWNLEMNKKDFKKSRFNLGSRQLGLNVWGNDEISYWSSNNYNGDNLIEYADFMAQQEKKVTTYEVTQEQFDLIEQIKKAKTMSLMRGISEHFSSLENIPVGNKAILRYIGGDETIEFKVKEQLYRLWRVDTDGDRVYMKFNYGTPAYISNKDFAFTAPLEEIKKWKTPAWEIEKAD